ncbi:MAG TPA: hypothetical protein VGK67_38560 [Myxococcales bacterium]|jgi:hypothetical protein
MSLRTRSLVVAGLLACLAACAHSPGAASANGPAAQAAEAQQVWPKTPAEAEQLKAAGSRWSDCEIRGYYNQLVAQIAASDAALKAAGKTAEERARTASEHRHNARLTCRAMMESRAEVEKLRARDQEKYGNPDGPTFDQLMEKNRAKGLAGDAPFEEIVASSQRTDEAVNRECGIRPR